MPEEISEKSAENGSENKLGSESESKSNKVVEKLKRKKSVKARKSEIHKPNEAVEESPKSADSPPRTRPTSPVPHPRSPLPVTPSNANGVAKLSHINEQDDDALREGMATALFDYDPQENDELAFSEGAILEVLEVQDDGWVTARDANGATGLVPGNYVKMLRTVTTQIDENDTEVDCRRNIACFIPDTSCANCSDLELI